MRRDPIITEDWKIGKTSYFQYNKLQYIDVVLSSLLIIIGVIVSYDHDIFIALLLWVLAFPFSVLVEIFVNQKNRSMNDRLLVIGLLIFYIYLLNGQLEIWVKIMFGVLIALKLINAPLQNFILNFHDEILIPNTSSVDLVLRDHISRFSETDYRVETNEEFQHVVNSTVKVFLTILFVSLVTAVSIELLNNADHFIGLMISLAIITITGLTFSYTSVSWYISHRLELRKQKQSEFDTEDPVFPEDML